MTLPANACCRFFPMSLGALALKSHRILPVSPTISMRLFRLKFGRSRTASNWATVIRLLPDNWIAVAIAAVP